MYISHSIAIVEVTASQKVGCGFATVLVWVNLSTSNIK